MSAVDESPAAGPEDPDLPIENYAELTVAKVLPHLHGLTRAELWQVHEFERQHANRVAVLDAIQRALG